MIRAPKTTFLLPDALKYELSSSTPLLTGSVFRSDSSTKGRRRRSALAYDYTILSVHPFLFCHECLGQFSQGEDYFALWVSPP
jgi:hypothetical protein